jgi:radical SAM-linked protein
MTQDNSPIKQRLQITFGKFDALIYTSNLDLAKIWERALRRAELPILYSEGFNPRPRIQLASALPLGISSECEVLDVALREPIALDGLAQRILEKCPTGLRIFGIREVPIRAPALQSLIRSAEYRIHFEDPLDRDALKAKVQALLDAPTLERERERKGSMVKFNLRPLVHGLFVDEAGDLIAHLAIGEQGNLRPDEILHELGLDDLVTSIHRTRIHFAE